MNGVPFFVNFDQKVYTYYILSQPDNHGSIEILLEGNRYTLILDDQRKWIEDAKPRERHLESELIQVIGKFVAKRFHISIAP